MVGLKGTIPRTIKDKPSKGKKAAKTPERALQSAVEHYLDLRGVYFIRIPDSVYNFLYARGSVPIHIKVLIARYLSGAPDITALITEGGVCRALPLELKSDVGKMSEKQLEVQGQIGTVLVRDFDTAKRLIDDFIQGKPCL